MNLNVRGDFQICISVPLRTVNNNQGNWQGGSTLGDALEGQESLLAKGFKLAKNGINSILSATKF